MTHDTAFVVGLLAGFCLSGVLVTVGLFMADLLNRRSH